MAFLTNARIAGFAFLFYIAAGICGMAAAEIPHAAETLRLFTALTAVVLGVTLYVITREAGPEIALLGLACRIVEAGPGDGTFFFAIASTAFAWLLLRGRMVPAPLAWLGVIASVLLAIVIPLQQFGLFGGPMNWASAATWITWLPMLIYEIGLGSWLLFKGARPPISRSSEGRSIDLG